MQNTAKWAVRIKDGIIISVSMHKRSKSYDKLLFLAGGLCNTSEACMSVIVASASIMYLRKKITQSENSTVVLQYNKHRAYSSEAFGVHMSE